jgi:hypothetical protein
MRNTDVQNVLVLDHLKKAPITPIDALHLYGCFRLAARIYELREDGHQIHTNRVLNSDGNPYAEYVLLKLAGRHTPDERKQAR